MALSDESPDVALGMPAHSPAGLAARDVLWRGFNDINFYVEDAEQENLYFEIVS